MGAQKGGSQGGGDSFPFWASQRSRLVESGDTDRFFQGPLDGAHEDGWRKNWFWSGGLLRSVNTGEGVCLDFLFSQSIGDGKLKPSKEESPAGLAGV